MNLLIVDDEYYIVKNIAENIPWTDCGVDHVFTAYSADQARKIISGPEPVDILLADIEMPRESGLSLVSWAHDNQYYPVTIFVTGHQRFDYAHTAITLHTFSYLLKPVDMTELQEQIMKAVQQAKVQAKMHADVRTEAAENAAVNTVPLPEAEIADNDTISRIKKFAGAHLSDPDLNRQMIADHVHMNLDYMSHLFVTKTGVSLSSYIQDLRIREAKSLLVSTNLSLSEISERTGFSNTSYFHRQFKKSCGMTPQSYRDMNSRQG